MKQITMKIIPYAELGADTTRQLEPAHRWVWLGLRMLAHSSPDYPCLKYDDNNRRNNERIARNLKIDVEMWIDAKTKLLEMQAISIDDFDNTITVHEGHNKGDRLKKEIIRNTLEYLHTLTGIKPVKKWELLVEMGRRILEGAELEDFKAVIDHAEGLATDEQVKQIDFIKLFRRKYFWDWVVKAR